MDSLKPLQDIPAYVQRVERLGYDGLHVAETTRDGFVACALALEHSREIVVRTAVIVALVRSPMMVAYQTWDLAKNFSGRFELGLGSQVRANVVDRFSMPWTNPVAQMREYVLALRAIFAAFQDGSRGLDFSGQHYRFSRLQPYFNPGPAEDPSIPIWLGAVGPEMVAVAGEVADGILTHSTNSSPMYLDEVSGPALARGAARTVRPPGDVDVVVSPALITGGSPEELEESRLSRRRALAFLLSTPAYRHTLRLLGRQHLQEELQMLTRQGRWDRLEGILTDDVLGHLTVEATFTELPEVLLDRYGGRAGGIVVQPPDDPSRDGEFARVLEELRTS